MKNLMQVLMVLALLFGAMEVKAGEVSEVLAGVASAVPAHELAGHGNVEPGENQRWNFRSVTNWLSFSVEPGYDREAVIRHASIGGLETQTVLELWASSAKIGSENWRKGFALGNALYQVGYPVATILGQGVDIRQYEANGGSELVKYGLLAIGSYKISTLITGNDPLAEWITAGVGQNGEIQLLFTGRFHL